MKVLYGILISSLLVYQKLRKDIEAICFKVNPYDSSVANNMIRDKQITITWHVNDPKVSHADKDIVDFFIEFFKEIYEDVTKIIPSRGNIHDYPAMMLYYTTTG